MNSETLIDAVENLNTVIGFLPYSFSTSPVVGSITRSTSSYHTFDYEKVELDK